MEKLWEIPIFFHGLKIYKALNCVMSQYRNTSVAEFFFRVLFTTDLITSLVLIIHQKGAQLQNCFEFVDETVLRISSPKINQNIVYNGHKRVHRIKFQSLALPNGLIDWFSAG